MEHNADAGLSSDLRSKKAMPATALVVRREEYDLTSEQGVHGKPRRHAQKCKKMGEIAGTDDVCVSLI